MGVFNLPGTIILLKNKQLLKSERFLVSGQIIIKKKPGGNSYGKKMKYTPFQSKKTGSNYYLIKSLTKVTKKCIPW